MAENSNYDFRTPLQKQQEQRKKNIIAMFKDCRAKAGSEVSNNRIITVIAQRVGCTAQNVRVYLLKEGLIVAKKRERK